MLDCRICVDLARIWNRIIRTLMPTTPENKHPTKHVLFAGLIDSIQQAHGEFSAQAGKAVNVCLTLRNWLIGCYITEYELHGADRAEYGQHLIEDLSKELQDTLDRCYTGRYLRLCRQFYTTYPQIRKSLISKSLPPLIRKSAISKLPSITGESESSLPQPAVIRPETIVSNLSFTHIIELLKCDTAAKRVFYELECIRGGWSVRELKRQIGSLYYERSGLSNDKNALSRLANQVAERRQTKLDVRDPYVFEFLGLRPAEVMSESHLEDQLTDKLQAFLLELGHGFCFEARQKRILIGGEYFFIDLVFYHRVLKCHVLVELKIEAFNHENLGQLNTYVSWYRENMMTDGDNPPVGILLCTDKKQALAEYALAGMDDNLFVSQYQVQLPTRQAIQTFINQQLHEGS